jgi:16S rRNA (guanine966-N2)-methyltransferase
VRIIAGEWKGRPLVAPVGDVARPTTDRVKESMFNLMGHHAYHGVVVDLFAGSGALGLEALSRGADFCVFVDKNLRSIRAIRENLLRCQALERASVLNVDWKKAWSSVENEFSAVSWVFIDPPYRMGLWLDVLERMSSSPVKIHEGVVCEHPKGDTLPIEFGRFYMVKQRTYGDITVSIYRENKEK